MPRSFLVKKTKPSGGYAKSASVPYDIPSQAASTPKTPLFGSLNGISVRLNNGKLSRCESLYMWEYARDL